MYQHYLHLPLFKRRHVKYRICGIALSFGYPSILQFFFALSLPAADFGYGVVANHKRPSAL